MTSTPWESAGSPGAARPRPVAVHPCQSICVWSPTGETWRDDKAGSLRVFACRGCSSEWVRTEGWTPIDQDGQVPDGIAAERAVTSAPDAASAGNADR